MAQDSRRVNTIQKYPDLKTLPDVCTLQPWLKDHNGGVFLLPKTYLCNGNIMVAATSIVTATAVALWFVPESAAVFRGAASGVAGGEPLVPNQELQRGVDAARFRGTRSLTRQAADQGSRTHAKVTTISACNCW